MTEAPTYEITTGGKFDAFANAITPIGPIKLSAKNAGYLNLGGNSEGVLVMKDGSYIFSGNSKFSTGEAVEMLDALERTIKRYKYPAQRN